MNTLRTLEAGLYALLAALAGAAWAATGSGLAGLACAVGVVLAARVARREAL